MHIPMYKWPGLGEWWYSLIARSNMDVHRGPFHWTNNDLANYITADFFDHKWEQRTVHIYVDV